MSTAASGAFGSEPKEQTTIQHVTGQTQEKAQELAGQAQEQAQQVAGHARNRIREQLDQRSSQVAEQIATQASDLRSVSDTLREQGKEGPANAAGKLAEYAERVGGYLSDRDSDGLLADAEDFGRRQPWAVAAGGVALGFAAARFLKASSGRRYASRSASSDDAPALAGGPPPVAAPSRSVGALSPSHAPGAVPPVPTSSPLPPTTPPPGTPGPFPPAAPGAEPRTPMDPTPVRTSGL
jgi:hypothetical protein